MPTIIQSKSNSRVKNLFKLLIYSVFILYVTYIFFFYNPYFSSMLTKLRNNKNPNLDPSSSPTTIHHVVFGIASSTSTWQNRTSYISSRWRPGITKGYIFLEKCPNDSYSWPNSLPPFRISQNTSKYKAYDKHPIPQAIRMARIILEMFDFENRGGVRWFVLADDDTVFFINNLVDVLARYDHEKYFYIGMNSESHASNFFHSFEMAFGGAGYALSYPLAKAVVKNLDVCLKRYPSLYGSDHILQSCVADLGVSITQEKGFHQIDLHDDISGFLSAHPQSPLLSLHHFGAFDPIFPSMNRTESLNHLMKVAKEDESRLLQQTICYHKAKNWSISISFGYNVHLYESIILPSTLRQPLQTFTPWTNLAKPFFVFNTRIPNKNPCDAPHEFFFDSIIEKRRDILVMSYIRWKARKLPTCTLSGNHSADFVSKIHVISPTKRHDLLGNRRECCDVVKIERMDATIKFRNCLENEILP